MEPSLDAIYKALENVIDPELRRPVTELDEWARELERLARRAEVFAYLNNDWEGFAIRNARGLQERLSG